MTAVRVIDDHLELTSIGSNTHAQIDSHISNTSNPHTVTKAQVGLGSVIDGAEINVQSDWDAIEGDAFILNKPSDITDLSGHAVTELSDVTGAGSGIIMSSAERTKLTGIEGGATADQSKADIDGLGLSHDSLVDVSSNDHHNELHSIASHNDTTATGAQLNTLTDNSMANTLHRHSELVASDGNPDPALSVDATGRVGIDTNNPGCKFEVVDSGYPVIRNTRTTSVTSSARASFDCLYKTTGNMVDGFGGGVTFSIQDNASGPNYIAGIYSRRNGSDTTGDLMFYTKGAAWNSKMIITKDGQVGIGDNPSTSCLLHLTSTTGALLLTRTTTVQKNALTAVNGMILYDSTLNKFQGYENGAWTNLI